MYQYGIYYKLFDLYWYNISEDSGNTIVIDILLSGTGVSVSVSHKILLILTYQTEHNDISVAITKIGIMAECCYSECQ
jgi:hypothetical protein